MRPKFYPVLERSIEEGVRLGLNRAHKHDPDPTIDNIVEQIQDAVLLVLSENFIMPVDESIEG